MRMFFLSIFFVVTVLSVVVLALLNHWSGQSGPQKTEQIFTIERGENAWVVATHLEERRLIENRFGFLYALAYSKKLSALVAGEYRLSGNFSAREIAVRVSTGQALTTDTKVTFPEGFTAAQMANRLTEVGLPGKEFLDLAIHPRQEWRNQYSFLHELPMQASLEGFLFPDTYLFDRQADAGSIIERMLTTFEQKAWPVITETGAEDSALDPYHRLILASIVEMEVRSDTDRRLVADIFLRRLGASHALESDATVQYVLGLNKVQHSFAETRTDSPYNTYVNKGLPPGPIANPGRSSLQAVVSPTKNKYFYFLSDPTTGETFFAVTFDDHLRNKSAHGL